MEIKGVKIANPKNLNFILGQTHFIKSVEDIHEALVNAVPGIEFGLAFCEASGEALVRVSGTNEECIDLAQKNTLELSAGHVFIMFLKNCFPLNVLNSIKAVPEVASIFCATANPVEVIIAENESGRGVLGVIDGIKSAGVETEKDRGDRITFLRKIGYKIK